MKNAWLLAVLVACEGGGQSIAFDQCDHTTLDSTCCVTALSCGENGRCVPPEQRTVTGFCATDEECSEGEFCDPAVGRCDELPCPNGDECPTNFECRTTSCFRLACEDGSECAGYCVEGGCFARAGECRGFGPDPEF